MRNIAITIMLALSLTATAKSQVYSSTVKTLQVVVNQEWLSPPVMKLKSGDVLNVDFDELSHTFHRYIYRLEHCEADWTPSNDLFETDWLEGFNDNPIEDYENSINTTVLYTHYSLQIPNERCRVKMSGNYKLHIIDEDEDEEVACAEFYVVEPLMNVGISATTNTDISFNTCHQQISMTTMFGPLNVRNYDEQLWTVVMQNGREDNCRINAKPSSVQRDRLLWEHNRDLIFDAGNEYHKFEVLDVSHPTMGIDRMVWDGHNYQAYPFANGPRRSYMYDQDANGAFYIRNSDNIENERTCDYVYVNYKMLKAEHYNEDVIIDGTWTTDDVSQYVMTYDERDKSYNARILQKQGYYSYQYLLRDADGQTSIMPEEGSFFETENKYQAFVYYKGTGERTWRLVGYQQITLR